MADDYTPLSIPEDLAVELAPFVEQCIAEVRKLLPDLTIGIEYVWDNNHLIKEVGSGGMAVTPTLIAVAFDPDFNDRPAQKAYLRGSIFHECFHLVQGWTGFEGTHDDPTFLDNAILEGTATVFERERTESDPLWGKYEPDSTMRAWLEEVSSLPRDTDIRKYKFWDPETKRRWVLYKLGTWIADKTLEANPDLQIEDLATMPPGKVLELASILPEA